VKKIYDARFKMKVVSEYLKGKEGYRRIARKYNLPDATFVRKWVNQYKQYGIQAWERKKTRQDYTGEFKLKVLHYMKTTGASYRETSNHFGIHDSSILSVWRKKFQEGGAEALQKGRPPTMEKKQKRNYKKKPLTREQELEREIELLKIENEYLKKLHAFQQNPDLLGKHKP
jgi:transposase